MNEKGFEILHTGSLNKSVSFTENKREQLNLKGLLHYAVKSQDNQVKKSDEQLTP